MQQRMERLKGGSEAADEGAQPAGEAERDDPIVALEPDELKQGSNFTGVKAGERSTMRKEQSY